MPLLVSSHGEVPARAEGISSLGRCPQGRRGTFYIITDLPAFAEATADSAFYG